MAGKLCFICGKEVGWIVRDIYDPFGAALMSRFHFSTDRCCDDIGICLPCFEKGRQSVRTGMTEIEIALN
jgi:hypothetical protein